MANQSESATVTWEQLGCPKTVGTYEVDGEAIRVRNIHIAVADDDPAATFTIIARHPPMGPAEFSLGHRID